MSIKHYFVGTALLASMGAHAQNSRVVSAYNYMNDGDYDKAAEYIEPATTNETTAGKEKTWRYRGTIYGQIALGKDEALKAKYPKALEQAVESYIKANELDPKGGYKEENTRALMNLQITALNGGNDAFNQKHYDKAIEGYLQSERISKALGRVDSNAVFNSALAYESKGDTAMAILRYAECIKIGYDKPEVYRYLAGMQKRTGNLDAAIATTKQGIAKYPENKELMLDQVAFQLDGNRMEEAETSVKAAIEKDPTNPVLYSVLGSLYDGKANPKEGTVAEGEMVKWYELAEQAYKKSIEVDPTFFDSYYNIGVLYNNRAAFEYEKCNQIKDDTKYAACKEKADQIYLQTIPFFEKAHELKPEDMASMQQLKKLYAKAGNTEKYNAIKKLLGE
ncbi:MAG: tetratricopeptide repeat protein [Flavobacteriales bacterium]|nr:tetratricopeptide repeat protein [Flavobacteriales bacterium]MBP9080866.1 tetratricopeptide repeat protein [Flavobacteriales bacterium]